jgi:hypothetical protein
LYPSLRRYIRYQTHHREGHHIPEVRAVRVDLRVHRQEVRERDPLADHDRVARIPGLREVPLPARRRASRSRRARDGCGCCRTRRRHRGGRDSDTWPATVRRQADLPTNEGPDGLTVQAQLWIDRYQLDRCHTSARDRFRLRRDRLARVVCLHRVERARWRDAECGWSRDLARSVHRCRVVEADVVWRNLVLRSKGSARRVRRHRDIRADDLALRAEGRRTCHSERGGPHRRDRRGGHTRDTVRAVRPGRNAFR